VCKYDIDMALPDDVLPDAPAAALNDRLGYLVKHAHQRLRELTARALGPFGITGRECAVLLVIDDRIPLSQQDVAQQLGVDRTTMVAILDELESKGLVERRQDVEDRRRNVVALTKQGTTVLQKATTATKDAEREFFASLTSEEAAEFTRALRKLAFPEG
jgi:DNA-binding MarR family transcriptional regulator